MNSSLRILIDISLIVLVFTSAQARQTDTPRELVKGDIVERELAGGEVHFYQLNAAAGQFLHVVVDQKGIDVVVRLLDPADKQIIEVDGPNGAQGPETIYALIPQSGNYRLAIRSLDKNAPAGRYQISLRDLRLATTKDTHLARATKAAAEAFSALAQGTGESLKLSRQKFLEALPDYRLAGDTAGEADALTRIGDASADSGENDEAVKYYNLALPLWRSIGDLKAEAITLSNLAYAYDSLGDKKKAFEYYDQSLVPTRKVGDLRGEAITLNNIGLVYYSIGEKQKALDYFNLALSFRKTLGDRRGEAITLNNIGLVFESLGELPKALENYSLSLAIMKSLGNQRGEAVSLSNVGKIHALMLDYGKARTYYEEALSLHRKVGDRNAETNALTNLGRIESSSGQTEKAFAYFNQALTLATDLNDRRGEANALASMGDLYATNGDYSNALSRYQQALPLWKAISDRKGEADTLCGMARVELKRGNLTIARDRVQSAIPLIEFMRTSVSGPDLRTSYFATTQQAYELLIEILMRSHATETALQVNEQARARSLLELLAEARVDIREGVDPVLVQHERALHQQLDQRIEYQFRLLTAKHSQKQAAALVAEIDGLTDQLRQVEAQLRAASPAYAHLTQPPTSSLTQIRQVLDPDTILLEYSLGDEQSYLWVISQKGLVEFLTLPKRADIEAVAQTFTRLLSEGASLERIDHTAEELSRRVLAPAARYLRGKRLVIVADGALHYVPFTALPLRRMQGRWAPLLAHYEVVNLPSASTLAALRQMPARQRPSTATLAVIADPVFRADDPRVKPRSSSSQASAIDGDLTSKNQRAADGTYSADLKRAGADLSRLTFSRYEAEGLLELIPRDESFAAFDFAANQDTVTSPNVGRYRLLHIATHGYFNPDRPQFSGLVLSLVDQFGQPQDGFLSLSEIYNLKLSADLVVLSACQTGLGRQVRGEGLVGLTRGFMYAGSPRIVASLWAVGDRATAELMRRFYTAMLKRKLSPAAALRAAQLSMLREPRWSAPQEWAGFVFQGEWRN